MNTVKKPYCLHYEGFVTEFPPSLKGLKDAKGFCLAFPGAKLYLGAEFVFRSPLNTPLY